MVFLFNTPVSISFSARWTRFFSIVICFDASVSLPAKYFGEPFSSLSKQPETLYQSYSPVLPFTLTSEVKNVSLLSKNFLSFLLIDKSSGCIYSYTSYTASPIRGFMSLSMIFSNLSLSAKRFGENVYSNIIVLSILLTASYVSCIFISLCLLLAAYISITMIMSSSTHNILR